MKDVIKIYCPEPAVSYPFVVRVVRINNKIILIKLKNYHLQIYWVPIYTLFVVDLSLIKNNKSKVNIGEYKFMFRFRHF